MVGALDILYWALALGLALWSGSGARADDPRDPAGLLRTGGIALAWCFGWIYLTGLALFGVIGGGLALGLLGEMLAFTALTGLIWGPVFVMAYLARALRERRT